MTSMEQSILEAKGGSFESFGFAYEFRAALKGIGGPEPATKQSEAATLDVSYSGDASGIRFSLADPKRLPWSIAFTLVLIDFDARGEIYEP